MELNDKLKASRYPSRQTFDRNTILDILDEAMFCTVAYSEDNQPYQIPTGFCRIGDSLFIHGSSKSHFLDQVKDGRPVSISVFLFDALVLAPTAFDHSVNYRSVIIFSSGRLVEEEAGKRAMLTAFTEKYIPGRMKDLPDITGQQLAATTVIAFDFEHSSCKRRNMGVGGDLSESHVWSGVIPVQQMYGKPQPDPSLPEEVRLPTYLKEFPSYQPDL